MPNPPSTLLPLVTPLSPEEDPSAHYMDITPLLLECRAEHRYDAEPRWSNVQFDAESSDGESFVPDFDEEDYTSSSSSDEEDGRDEASEDEDYGSESASADGSDKATTQTVTTMQKSLIWHSSATNGSAQTVKIPLFPLPYPDDASSKSFQPMQPQTRHPDSHALATPITTHIYALRNLSSTILSLRSVVYHSCSSREHGRMCKRG